MYLTSFPLGHGLMQGPWVIYLIPICVVNGGARPPCGVFKDYSNMTVEITLRKVYEIKRIYYIHWFQKREAQHTMQGTRGRSTKGVVQPSSWGAKRECEDSWVRISLEDQGGEYKQKAWRYFTGAFGCHQAKTRGGQRRGTWEKSDHIGAPGHLEGCSQPVFGDAEASGNVNSLWVAVKYSRKVFLKLI